MRIPIELYKDVLVLKCIKTSNNKKIIKGHTYYIIDVSDGHYNEMTLCVYGGYGSYTINHFEVDDDLKDYLKFVQKNLTKSGYKYEWDVTNPYYKKFKPKVWYNQEITSIKNDGLKGYFLKEGDNVYEIFSSDCETSGMYNSFKSGYIKYKKENGEVITKELYSYNVYNISIYSKNELVKVGDSYKVNNDLYELDTPINHMFNFFNNLCNSGIYVNDTNHKLSDLYQKSYNYEKDKEMIFSVDWSEIIKK